MHHSVPCTKQDVNGRFLLYDDINEGDKLDINNHFDAVESMSEQKPLAGKIFGHFENAEIYGGPKSVKWANLIMEIYQDGALKMYRAALPLYVDASTCHDYDDEIDEVVETVSFERLFLHTLSCTIYEFFCPDKCVFECSHPAIVTDLVRDVKAFAKQFQLKTEEERDAAYEDWYYRCIMPKKVGGKVKRKKILKSLW